MMDPHDHCEHCHHIGHLLPDLSVLGYPIFVLTVTFEKCHLNEWKTKINLDKAHSLNLFCIAILWLK